MILGVKIASVSPNNRNTMQTQCSDSYLGSPNWGKCIYTFICDRLVATIHFYCMFLALDVELI